MSYLFPPRGLEPTYHRIKRAPAPQSEQPVQLASPVTDAPLPQLRAKLSGTPVGVQLEPVVLDQIDAADARVNAGFGPYRLEVAGFLLVDPKRLDVFAVLAATDSSIENTRVSAEFRPLDDVETGRWVIAGAWHTHPNEHLQDGGVQSAQLTPSERDLRSFVSGLAVSRRDAWVALIAGRAEHGWEITAWLTRWIAGRPELGAKVEPCEVWIR